VLAAAVAAVVAQTHSSRRRAPHRRYRYRGRHPGPPAAPERLAQEPAARAAPLTAASVRAAPTRRAAHVIPERAWASERAWVSALALALVSASRVPTAFLALPRRPL